MNSPVRLILGIVFFALLLVYSAASFYIWLYPPGSDAGWYGSGAYGEFQVTQIDPEGPAKDLRPGDKIIAINGVNVAEHAGVLDDEYRLPPGSRYSMTVLRNGQELTFTWQTIPRRRGSFPWDKLISLLFWLSGLLVLLLKAEDRAGVAAGLDARQFFDGAEYGGCQGEIATNWLVATGRFSAHRRAFLVSVAASFVSLSFLNHPLCCGAGQVDEVAIRTALPLCAADVWRQPVASGMVYPNRQLAADALVSGSTDCYWPPYLSLLAYLVGGARLFVAELSYGGYRGAAAFARRDVGQPDRLQQSFSGARDGGDKHAGEVEYHLELVVVFDALYAAARPAQLRLCHRPPSRHSDQPDHSPRCALSAGLARFDFAGVAVRRTHRDGAVGAAVQVSAPIGLDHRPGFGCRRHRRVAVGALVAPALSRAGD